MSELRVITREGDAEDTDASALRVGTNGRDAAELGPITVQDRLKYSKDGMYCGTWLRF
jgi:hypothetical protein